jgi:hypothetical protein
VWYGVVWCGFWLKLELEQAPAPETLSFSLC